MRGYSGVFGAPYRTEWEDRDTGGISYVRPGGSSFTLPMAKQGVIPAGTMPSKQSVSIVAPVVQTPIDRSPTVIREWDVYGRQARAAVEPLLGTGTASLLTPTIAEGSSLSPFGAGEDGATPSYTWANAADPARVTAALLDPFTVQAAVPWKPVIPAGADPFGPVASGDGITPVDAAPVIRERPKKSTGSMILLGAALLLGALIAKRRRAA